MIPTYEDADKYRDFVLTKIIKEADWYYQNVKGFALPLQYHECLRTAIHYVAQGSMVKAEKAVDMARKMRKEYEGFGNE